MGPFSQLVVDLRACTAFHGLGGELRIEFGRKKIPAEGAPPRIVLVPVRSTLTAPGDKKALTQENPVILAHLWAEGRPEDGEAADHDALQDLTDRLYRALDEQALGVDPPDGTGKKRAGLKWLYEPGTIAWEDEEVVVEQGEVKLLAFTVVLPVLRTPLGRGRVDQVKLQ